MSDPTLAAQVTDMLNGGLPEAIAFALVQAVDERILHDEQAKVIMDAYNAVEPPEQGPDVLAEHVAEREDDLSRLREDAPPAHRVSMHLGDGARVGDLPEDDVLDLGALRRDCEGRAR